MMFGIAIVSAAANPPIFGRGDVFQPGVHDFQRRFRESIGRTTGCWDESVVISFCSASTIGRSVAGMTTT
jgi:hypothetical protein